MTAAVLNKVDLELKNGKIENCRIHEEIVIVQKVKSNAKEVVTNDLITMVKTLLDNNLRTSFYNPGSGLRQSSLAL